MEKRIDCRDIDLECDFAACGQTDEEVIRKAGEHIQAIHGMESFSREFYDKARGAVRPGSCETAKDCTGGVCKL